MGKYPQGQLLINNPEDGLCSFCEVADEIIVEKEKAKRVKGRMVEQLEMQEFRLSLQKKFQFSGIASAFNKE